MKPSKRFQAVSFETLEYRQLLAGDALSDLNLELIVRDSYLPDIPMLVRAQLVDDENNISRDLWDGIVTLSSSNENVQLAQTQITMINGVGSVLLHANGNEDFELTATIAELSTSKSIRSMRDDEVSIGSVDEVETIWSGIVRVDQDIVIEENQKLTIMPGTLITMAGVPVTDEPSIGAKIRVLGTLVAEGTRDQPITMTAANPDQPWGEIDVDGGVVDFDFVNVTAAGNSPRGGHTGTGPAFRMDNGGTIRLESSNVTDIRGKIMESESGSLEMHRTLFSRAVMGPEINDTALDMDESWLVDMAGRFHYRGRVDDNDSIYLHSQSAGQQINIRDSVVAGSQDDGIDVLGADIVVSNTIIRDIDDKAASLFRGDSVFQNVVVSDADIGINAKGSGSDVMQTDIIHTTITNVRVAVRAQDKDDPDPDVTMNFDVRNSILHVDDGGETIQTDYDPNEIRVNYSVLSSAWNHEGSGVGNLVVDPLFLVPESHDFRLHEDSPAIDAGDPESAPDEDGTRADMGAIPFQRQGLIWGDFNRDGQLNIDDVDLLCAAVQHEADDQFDLNEDGLVDAADLSQMIQTTLQTSFGDANLDGVFNSADLIAVFQAGQYEDTESKNSTWATGDWNCDGEFSSGDMVTAFQKGNYQPAAVPSAGRNESWLDSATALRIRGESRNRFGVR